MDKPEALRLADELDQYLYSVPAHPLCTDAAAELRRLHADAEESEALRERLSELLRNTAIALRGPEPELTRWSWHDLPELAAALKAQRDALLEALKLARPHINPNTLDGYYAEVKADAAIMAVEETK